MSHFAVLCNEKVESVAGAEDSSLTADRVNFTIQQMKTDSIFYRLFELRPETLFLLLGETAKSAQETAAHYQFQAIEFKEPAHRADGVFLPREPDLPLYFLEVQFCRLSSVYADLLVKAFT
jgi:hypothetical protein